MITQEEAHDQVAVINRKFCFRHPINLVITRNIWQIGQGNYVVRNTNGKLVFKIEGSVFSFDHKRVMLDAAGVPIVTLRKKAFSVLTTWQVFRGEGKDEKDLIFNSRRSSIFQMKTKLVVFMAKNKSEDVCNYAMKGSLFERSCQVYDGDSNSSILAQVHKDSYVDSLVSGKDRFKVSVSPNVDCVFIVALIVILDEIVARVKRKSNNKQKR